MTSLRVRFKKTPLELAQFDHNHHFKDVFNKLDIFDRRFVIERIKPFDYKIQRLLIMGYRKRKSVFDANTYQRETTDSIRFIIPHIFRNTLNIDEVRLREMALALSENCLRLVKQELYQHSPVSELRHKANANALKQCQEYIKDKGLIVPEANQPDRIEGVLKRLCDETS